MNTIKYSLVASLAIVLMTGCDGGDSTEPSVEVEENTFDLFGNGVKGQAIFGKKSDLSVDVASTTYKIKSLTSNACKGEGVFSPKEFAIDENSTQAVNFNISYKKFEHCITDKITLNYSVWQNGVNLQDDVKLEVKNPAYLQKNVSKQSTDPLFKYQWHLKNTGQSLGVATPAVKGNDINVEDIWKQNIKGSGTTVAIIDSGVDMFHPDLKKNLILNLSHNYHTGKLIKDGGINNTTPVRYEITMANPETGTLVTGGYYDYRHGTAVAGLVGAEENNIGTRGVAPKAKLVSFNALEFYKDEALDLFKAHKIPYLFSNSELQHYRSVDALTAHLDKIDIYNNSWGNSQTLNYNIPDVHYEDTLKYGVVQGRGGKGAIYVKSAGNGGELSWSNFEPMQTNGYFIVVGASGADGKASSYTTYGPNILINAPGGGSQSEFVKPDLHEIVTTDMAGNQRGYDSKVKYHTSYTSHLKVAGNENYDYTQLMNGTSAAAPIVSGVVALMLEANPNLTWRDVRYILSHSAYKNDPSNASWKQNGAGLWYNYAYGFGRVDAKAAVQMSKGFESLGKFADMKNVKASKAVMERSKNGETSSTIKIDDDIKIENVKVKLNLDLNSSITYKTYNFSGTGSKTTAPFTLYQGTSLATLSSSFQGADANTTYTDAKLILEEVISDDSSDITLGKITFDNQKSIRKKISLEKPTTYRLAVDSNTSSWSVKIVTPMPHTIASNLQVTLTSPDKTESLLAVAPNGLSATESYRNAVFSSVQFTDEKSAGEWKLDVKDVNWTSDYDTTYKLENWSLEITGR
ncbi:MAG: S8 family serine peptidase [Campylobacteraceae bacterium]|nr:S8 family serine peptidase [Campylobacteraceae bacterium]